ncbi:MAG: sdhA [Chlamydiia bacterium]|nr:sdhA [Chlamydiia bacterium]
MKEKTVIVVGGGLAGLSCAMKLAEQGIHVKIVSITKVKRSHSVCAQGGINAAFDPKGEGDSPLIHAYETIKGGDFLADQPPVVEMCLAAPHIIHMMERLGCPFNRTPEGNVDVRRFGGTLYHRTVFCGTSTGQQLLYTLDEQVRRYEVKGLIQKFENHDFLRLCMDENGVARGIVMMDIFNLKIEVLQADAVVIATGGLGVIFRKSTNSTSCTGTALGRLFMQGVWYANGEFIQIHPTAIPGEDKLRLISESARGEGGRVWVVGDSSKKITNTEGVEIPCGKTGEPWYFLEELYPIYGNLVPRDIAAREILRICALGLGVNEGSQVYLDVSHLPVEKLKRMASILELYEKFTGDDPKKVPMRIFPAVHYTMGGAWVDFPAADAPDRLERFRQMTNIRGCFVIGEADFQYHGANRLGANSLLSCIFGGLTSANEMPRYLETVKGEPSPQIFQRAIQQEEERRQELLQRKGPENIHLLHDELAEWMVKHVTVIRDNDDLIKTIDKIKELRVRQKNISLADTTRFANQTYLFASQFEAMLEVALVITKGALLRNESRGCHFKAQFATRNDSEFLKTTIAMFAEDEPKISYLPVNTQYLRPTARDYSKIEKKIPHFEGLAIENIHSPV